MIRNVVGVFTVAIMLLSLLTSCSRKEEMRRQLAALQARNQADSLLTDEVHALALANYFDKHGTPNERMEAHYLLGRTYADLGEAPRAVSSFHDAISSADTSATDCDYARLCRVYAQMSDIFYKQNLMQDYLQCLDQSIRFAELAKDTMVAFNSLI